MQVLECPTQDVLADYASGNLSEEQVDPILGHLAECDTCQSAVDDLTAAGDSLIKKLRRPAAAETAGAGKAVESLMAKAERLVAQPLADRLESPPKSVPKPAPRVTAEVFWTHLEQSGLLDDAQIATLKSELSVDDGEELARELIRRKLLTKYQAGLLLRGRHKGLVLSNYVLEEKLGQGGMGMVFRARHKLMGRTVAIKVLPPSVAKTPILKQRFRREVQAAASLTHPNIVTAHDADQSGKVNFLVMELVEGRDLSQVVKEDGPLPVAAAVDAIQQMAKALEYAHSQGVVHRDIKPANALLTNDGVVKVLDMGLARIEGEFLGNSDSTTRAELTNTGAVMGTVDYMSPEQAVNTKNADQRTDIYSLGCTFFWLLTGRPVHEGETLVEKILAHREQPCPSLMQYRADAPEALDAVFQKMMAKSPDQRFSSMTEVQTALDACRPALATAPAEPVYAAAASTVHAAGPTVIGSSVSGVSDDDFSLNLVDSTLPGSDVGPLVNTNPAAEGDTFSYRGRRRKKNKSGPAKWWATATRPKNRKWLWSGAALMLALLAAIIIGIGGSGGDPGETQAAIASTVKTGKPTGVVAKAAAGQPKNKTQDEPRKGFFPPSEKRQLLIVLPSNGFWQPDMENFPRAMESYNIECTFASPNDKYAWSIGGKTKQQIKPDLSVHYAHKNPGKYDGVMLFGGDMKDFKKGSHNFHDLVKILNYMRDNNKPIAAACTSMRILGDAGWLKHKKVAKFEPEKLKGYQPQFCNEYVVNGGEFITTQGPDEPYEVAKLIRAKMDAKK